MDLKWIIHIGRSGHGPTIGISAAGVVEGEALVRTISRIVGTEIYADVARAFSL